VLLASLVASRPAATRATAIVAHLVALGIIVAVAFSRLYLGMHYLSDVLGGAAAGVAWLSACGATRFLVVGYRRAVEDRPRRAESVLG
jgi:undecaprenyl-diphosphatase